MKKVVLYLHENTETVVSKQCSSCGNIKLTDDFPTGRSVKTLILSDCSLCIRRKRGKK